MTEVCKGTDREEFYKAVSDICKTVDLSVADLRLSLHTRGFTFQDLQGIGSYEGEFKTVEGLTENYLRITGADREVFRFSRQGESDFRVDTAIKENTSILSGHVSVWKEYYHKKAKVDHWIRTLLCYRGELDEVDKINVHNTIITTCDFLNDFLIGNTDLQEKMESLLGADECTIRNTQTAIYKALGIKEDPELIYSLAFNSEVRNRGWDAITGNDLIAVLDKQGVVVGEFEYYTDRNLELEEESKNGIEVQTSRPSTAAETSEPGAGSNFVERSIDSWEKCTEPGLEGLPVHPRRILGIGSYWNCGHIFRVLRKEDLNLTIEEVVSKVVFDDNLPNKDRKKARYVQSRINRGTEWWAAIANRDTREERRFTRNTKDKIKDLLVFERKDDFVYEICCLDIFEVEQC